MDNPTIIDALLNGYGPRTDDYLSVKEDAYLGDRFLGVAIAMEMRERKLVSFEKGAHFSILNSNAFLASLITIDWRGKPKDKNCYQTDHSKATAVEYAIYQLYREGGFEALQELVRELAKIAAPEIKVEIGIMRKNSMGYGFSA